MNAEIDQPSPEAVIPNQDVSAEWVTYVPKQSYGVDIKAPNVGQITGTLTIDPNNPDKRGIYVDMFTADEPSRGSGKKLLEILKTEGLRYRARNMSGHFTSAAALGAFIGVVGGEGLSFYERLGGKRVQVDVEEAMKDPSRYIASAPIAAR